MGKRRGEKRKVGVGEWGGRRMEWEGMGGGLGCRGVQLVVFWLWSYTVFFSSKATAKEYAWFCDYNFLDWFCGHNRTKMGSPRLKPLVPFYGHNPKTSSTVITRIFFLLFKQPRELVPCHNLCPSLVLETVAPGSTNLQQPVTKQTVTTSVNMSQF